jgi:tryptophan-rich sensory protein
MEHPSRIKQVLGLLLWLGVAFLAAAAGAAASVSAGSFYMELTRPSWGPPAWLFGPVWTLLYTMMGIASWLVWRRYATHAVRTALVLYAGQLLLNAVWTWLFFVAHTGMWVFVEILILWFMILATILAFRRVSPLAAAMLVPYLLWVSFATVLTFTMWQLNPDML